jgi:hypothetical protein
MERVAARLSILQVELSRPGELLSRRAPVPEGPNDGSQAHNAWDSSKSDPYRRDGVIGTQGFLLQKAFSLVIPPATLLVAMRAGVR